MGIFIILGFLFTFYLSEKEILFNEGAGITTEREQTARLTDLPPIEKVIDMDNVNEIIPEIKKSSFTILTKKGIGSGFLYDTNGHIITNAHVVKSNKNVTVRNSLGQDYLGKVIGVSTTVDVAVIKVEKLEDMKPFPLELEKQTKIGTHVLIIGAPHGIENTVSLGYLVGTLKEIQVSDFVYKNGYEVLAKFAPGNSGGPLVDLEKNEIIGINSTGNLEETSGYSIPLYEAKIMINAIINDWN